MLKSLFIALRVFKKYVFLSVTAEYISNCFGVDLGVFIPTSHIHLQLAPQSNFQSSQPTSCPLCCQWNKKTFSYMQNTWNLLCVFSSSLLQFCDKLLLSRINSECNHRVSLFLPTAYLQYVNHGRNDVLTSSSPSIHQHSSHPQQPHTPSSMAACVSPDLKPAWVLVL